MGVWPTNEIDHVNRVRDDNRLTNLREATDAEQSWNRNKPAHNTSGFVGVSWHKGAKKWGAYIGSGGSGLYLGYFPTSELASAAYLEAKARLHKFRSLPRAA